MHLLGAVSYVQHYSPVAGNLAVSALVAALPVIVLLGLLGIFKVKAHWAALAGLATALVIAIAICAAMLIGLGFRPLQAAGLSLIGNTAPVAFGAIGTPIITLAQVSGLPLD